MRVCGFSIANNAVRLGYPIQESLRSMLPLVDEIILNVGEGDDETWDLVSSMREPKIKPFRSWWDPDLRSGGQILAQQTNLTLSRCQGDWGLYLQADEVLHECDYARIRGAFEDHRKRPTEALRFRYHHFYGSFQTIQDYPQRWYVRAIRAVKLGIGAVSRGDAMDFGLHRGGKNWNLRYADTGAYIYHYGWARPPEVMRVKREQFERLYHDDESLARELHAGGSRDIYSDLGNLRFFRGTHPEVMRERVARQDWRFEHGIESQLPDRIRHAAVWTDLYLRRALPFAGKLGQRFKRAWLTG
jgi:hypothetical protein